MADSVFKGAIATGTIEATLLSDSSNVDSDMVTISYAELGGGNPQVDQAVVVPGGSGDVSVSAPKKGVLEVLVATGHTTDSGRLSVSCDGESVHNEPIQGSAHWVYAVGA
jgi:hypothetical protein